MSMHRDDILEVAIDWNETDSLLRSIRLNVSISRADDSEHDWKRAACDCIPSTDCQSALHYVVKYQFD